MPIIPARIEYVFYTSRSTNLAIGDVVAALKAYQIDNLVIELTNLEPPVGNGSSDIFVSGDIHIEAHRHQYFWEKDQDFEQTKKQIYYSTDDHKRHVEEIVLRFIFILSYGTKVDYNLLGVTFHPDIVVLLCKLRSSSSRSLEVFYYRHNAEYILRGNNFKISRDIGSQYFHFIQRLSKCLHGFGINFFSGFKTINQSEEHQEYHDTKYSGHHSLDITFNNYRARLFFQRNVFYYQEAQKYCRACQLNIIL
ncbi:hypothetical protein ACTFIR_011869 [Dictyostelium discoideum]